MIKKLFKLILLGILISITSVLISNYSIENSVKGKTFDEVSEIKKNKVGLVLGTVKTLRSGYINPYFRYRIDATVELFKSGKIDFVLVSGDNGRKGYDEPTDFKEELMKRGIPEDKIYLDYAGFRTLDSVVRSKEIFGQESITIISQQFHNERAIYLAEHFGIDAVGYNAKDVSLNFGLTVQLREYLARTKVFFDLLFGIDAKFLGKEIEIK